MVAKNKRRRIILNVPTSSGKNSSFEAERIKKIRIKVIGIGDGAGNIVSEIVWRLKKASFLIANTDSSSLKKSPKNAETFQFGESVTSGLGTGMKPDLGETSAQESRERLKKILKGIDLCIFVATLGGGTGSGAAPIFAEVSKNLGNLNYGIFTLPFEFEGKKRMEIAKIALEKLRQNLNAFSLIENERIFQIIDRSTPLKIALSQLNKILAEGLEGLIEIIYQPGLINIDFADIKTILKGWGKLSYLNTIESVGEHRVKEAIEKVLNSPLYSYSINGSKGILYDIAGDKNLGLAEVGEISRSIFESGERGAKIIFGVSSFRNLKSHEMKTCSENKKLSGKIKVTILATGCRSKIFSEEVSQKISPRKAKRKVKRIETNKESPKTDSKVENVSPQTRKNALQLKKEAEEAEKELIEKEEFWETPAFFRQKSQNDGSN